MGEIDIDEGLRHELKAAWHRFLDLVGPERPTLHRYCRNLTENLWDAEDLVQDTLLRALGTLGKLDYAVRSPRAYLYRHATSAWLDAQRNEGIRATSRERAAVALKDAAGMSLGEIAEVLGSSPGAVESALQRGRSPLPAGEAEPAPARAAASTSLVDRFVDAYNAADVDALAGLLLENGTVEMLGCVFQVGPEARRGDRSWFRGAIGGHPEWPPALRWEAQRARRSELQGEPIVLVFRTRAGEEALESVVRLEEEGGMLRLLRVYSFCPETVREVASELGLEVRTGSYRYPTPAPGRSYRDQI